MKRILVIVMIVSIFLSMLAVLIPSVDATYDATISAYCNTEGVDVSVRIIMDGNINSTITSSYTFTNLTGSHTFTVSGADASGHPFLQWSTGQTSTTINVSSSGTYTAYYQASTPPTLIVTINAHCNTDGSDVSVVIMEDGSSTGFTTPTSFGITGTHTFTVANTDPSGHPFLQWSTGQTSTTINVSSSGTYTAFYQAAPSQSSTSVVCSPNPAPVGSSVTCTATVYGSNPTGTVTWSTSSIWGSFNQSICALSNGTCSTTYVDNTTGSVTIAASYSGDSNNAPSSGSTSLTVTSGGPVYYSANYTSVQAAFDAAPSGATVIIAPGFYTESLIVDKPFTIIGEKDPPVFGGGASGIYLTLMSGASGSNVTGIEITNYDAGILVVNASNCRIYSNIMASMGSSGIVLEGSNATHNVIFSNIFQDVPTPINLTTSADNNTIYGNIISSQATLTLNLGANGNSVYENSISASQVLLNITNSHGNNFYHNNFLAPVQLTISAAGNNNWDNSYPSGGNYWNNYAGVDVKSGSGQNLPGSDGIGDTPHIIDGNNMDHYPMMKPWPLATGHCIAVISVVTAKAVVGQGFSANITVCVADNGEYNESFSVTVYANATGIGTQQVSGLNASCQMVLTFVWKTAGLACGNYTISAYAQPVAGQTDMSGNDFTLGTLKVTVPGDIDGNFKVQLADLVILAKAYSAKPGNPNWNPNADIDSNNAVGLSDLVVLAQHYGQHFS
jgi:hypothetical protein